MNKKKFPKAVTRTADEMRAGEADGTPKSAQSDNVIEMMPKGEGVASRRGCRIHRPCGAGKAIAIVERYANLSADRRRHPGAARECRRHHRPHGADGQVA